ncbi:MAG: acyl-CoA dehydrogenase family protein [Gemmatimonadota bacterium]
MQRTLFEPDHDVFRQTFRQFLAREVVPNYEQWERDRIVPRAAWLAAGEQGFLCMDVPDRYGGAGVDDFRFKAVITEEIARANVAGYFIGLHTDIVVPYLLKYGNDEQKARWLPKAVTGESITAIAMSEPAAGSDLQGIQTTAVRRSDHYILNGQKTFISNGILADLVVVVAKTDPAAGYKGISLLVVERGMPGFERGRNLDKIGLHAQDTAELYFRDVAVPVENLLGREGDGFVFLMEALPTERLMIAIAGVATAEAALTTTVQYCREREAFGQKIGNFQHTRFELAEMKTAIEVSRAFVDRCIAEETAGTLTTDTASMAKWWVSDMAYRVTDRCLQLHGGYGYMREYGIARMYSDSRVAMIYGGSNEIMKEIIGRQMLKGD